jgi:hypothetical protein
MAFPTKEGGRKSSKFRANRADREHAKDKESPKMREPGERAQADELEAKTEGRPDEHEETPTEEAGEEMIHPDIHEEIKHIAAEHGPAHTVNMVHDHDGMKSHIHSVHMDGHEHHAQHDGEEHVQHAHEHGMHAAGLAPKEEPGVEENPASEHAEPEGGEESYGEPL